MTLFQKCPVCGVFAFVQPDLANNKSRFFKCGNGHIFKEKIQKKQAEDDKEVMDQLPEWVRILNDMTKHKKFGS
jgi:hypothetical protein